MRGPLEILRESWENQEIEQFNVSTWIEELYKQLQTIRDVAAQREEEAKKKIKKNYDIQSKQRELKEQNWMTLGTDLMKCIGKLDMSIMKSLYQTKEKRRRLFISIIARSGIRQML